MGKAKVKKISPEEKQYVKTCKLVGVWSLTELRFVTEQSLLEIKGLGKKTLEYIKGWLKRRGFTLGEYSLADYLESREKIWSDATGVIVFKYKIRPIISSLGITKEWAVGTFTPRKDAFDAAGRPKIEFRGVARADAEQLIEEYGLVLAMENADGWIYDTPDGKSLRQFGHKSANLSGANNIGLGV